MECAEARRDAADRVREDVRGAAGYSGMCWMRRTECAETRRDAAGFTVRAAAFIFWLYFV